MSIQYTIREISTSSVTVDYDDGSWAVVPINSLMTRQDIEVLIGDFQPKNGFNSVDDVPFSVGESGECLTSFDRLLKTKQEEILKEEEEEKNRLFTYSEIRAQNYPPLGDQLDALYWARQGDDTILQQIDQEIQNVKSQYPKDMTPMTKEDLTQSGLIP